MSLSAVQIASWLQDLEQSMDLDAADWIVGDMHLWPLYRMELYRLMFAGQAGPGTAAARPALGPALRRTRCSDVRAARPHPVWLVSDGISYSRLDGREFERFCGPLFHACRAQGRRAVIIDRASPRPRRAEEPTRWWAPETLRAKLLGTALARMAPDSRHVRLIERLRSAAAARAIPLPALVARRFDAMTRAIRSLAATLHTRMRREQVRLVFIVGYYDVAGYAFVLAASRAGALSVDIQHGLTGEQHMGYARWQRPTRDGLSLLPRCFWTWTDADAAVVRDWASRHRPAREAVVGGHPFLDLWRRGGMALPPAMSRSLEQLLSRSPALPRVLVTLQPNLTSADALAPLVAAWRQRPAASWWLRLHPMALSDKPQVEALLREHAVQHWDIDASSALPLPALLARSDLHATHSSSAIVEAELMGVPSLVWSTYGAELVPDAIERSTVSVALDGEAFMSRLQPLAYRRTSEAATVPSTADALRAVLELAP